VCFGAGVDRFWSFFVMMLWADVLSAGLRHTSVLVHMAILVAIRGVYWIGELGLHINVAVLGVFWTLFWSWYRSILVIFCSDALFAIGVVCVQRADVLSDSGLYSHFGTYSRCLLDRRGRITYKCGCFGGIFGCFGGILDCFGAGIDQFWSFFVLMLCLRSASSACSGPMCE
jgi:hypothetical protein